MLFDLRGGNKIFAIANVNNLGVAASPEDGLVTVKHGDYDLDGNVLDDMFTMPISAVIDEVGALMFVNDAADAPIPDTREAECGEGILYCVTIPETTETGSGVLPYFVMGDEPANTGVPSTFPAESITGVIGGDSASLFGVNNATMAITYEGPTGDLVAGVDHIIRLTASGDTGLANRLIVGMAKITIADVDSPPEGVPGMLPVTLYENVKETNGVGDDDNALLDGLVADESEVHDFAGVGADPEGRSLTYDTDADGFDFDGSKLVTDIAIGDIVSDGGDNPNTTEVETDADWPSGTPD